MHLVAKLVVSGVSFGALALAIGAKDISIKASATAVALIGMSLNLMWGNLEAEAKRNNTSPKREKSPKATRKKRISVVCDASSDRRDNHSIAYGISKRHDDLFYKHSEEHEHVLEDLQLILVIDRSGSMNIKDKDASGQGRTKSSLSASGRWTRWDNCVQAAKYLAQAVFAYDKDGEVPVILFDDEVEERVVNNMEHLFRYMADHPPTDAGTNLLEALEMAVVHMDEDSPNLIIVLTDGEPNPGQEPRIKRFISKKFSGTDNKILFIRMGDDEGAIRFLGGLDDCKQCGENVDTKSDNAVYAMGPRNVLLNALFEHLDDVFDDEELR